MTAPFDAQARDFAVPVELAGKRLDLVLATLSGLTRNEARRSIEQGAVYLSGSRCQLAATSVPSGELLRLLPTNPDRTQIDEGQLRVVYRDDWLMIVDKPAGLPTQPPPRGGDALSIRVRATLDPRAYLGELHRLDRDVSGLVMYGLRPDGTANLAEQLRYHRATRRYLGLVHTAIPVPQQTISEPIREITPGRMGLHPAGMPAKTHVMPLDFAAAERMALVLLALETGRSHQIRLHLAWAAGALLGDRQYGDTLSLPRIGLHAALLRLRHPEDGQQCTWTLPPPPDFWALTGGAPLQLPADWAMMDPRPYDGPKPPKEPKLPSEPQLEE